MRSMKRARKSALAAVPRPKALAALITAVTETPKALATVGAIGPSTSELAPMTPTQNVKASAAAGSRAVDDARSGRG